MKLALHRPHIGWVLMSLLVVAATALAVWSLVVLPLAQRRHRGRVLSGLTSADWSHRQWALNDLIQQAASDDPLLGGALDRMSEADPLNTLQILNALRLAAMLRDPRVLGAAARRMARADLEYMGKYHSLFLGAEIGDHPLILAVLTERLNTDNDDQFLYTVGMLKSVDQWRQPPVSAATYLRWLRLVGNEPDTSTRLLAVERAVEALNLADEPDLLKLFRTWLNDPNHAVRNAALMGLAELAGSTCQSEMVIALIAHATTNSDTEVARRAWILLGLLHAADRAVIKQLDPRIAVAEATLWALDVPPEALDLALKDVQGGPDRRRLVGMHAYGASLRARLGDKAAITRRLEATLADLNTGTVDESTQIMLWRLLLALRAVAPESDQRIRSLYERCKAFNVDDHKLDPLAVVAAFCAPVSNAAGQVWSWCRPHRLLATIEALPVDRHVIRIAADAPVMLRTMAVRVSKNPDPNDLMPGFRSTEPALRDLSCVIAADRFTPHQHAQLVERLLTDYSDDAKRSGAILAGLTGVQPELLRRKMLDEDIWSVKQIHRLGMWMQGNSVADEHGQPIAMRKLASSLLARDDLPVTTVQLAILKQSGDTVPACPSWPAAMAFDALLNPHRSNQLDLGYLLATHRWWYVLHRFLPAESPPFWVWADPALQTFQVQVLRNWYLIHRHKRGAEAVSSIRGASPDYS